MRRWGPSFALLAAGCLALAAGVSRGDVVTLVAALLLVVVAVIVSPAPFPSTDPDWRARLEAGDPVVFHRPGCPYCLRLRRTVGKRAGRAAWVDIWAEPDAAARVRAITGGDETVPTVVVGSEQRVNPDPAWVREQLAG